MMSRIQSAVRGIFASPLCMRLVEGVAETAINGKATGNNSYGPIQKPDPIEIIS